MLFYVHTTFYIFYYFYISFSFLHVSLLTVSPSLLSSSTNPSFFLHIPIINLHEPNHHRPIAANPRSATDLTHLSLSSLFSTFRLCVSGCACVSALCFGMCLCFEFVFKAGFLFQAWVSIWLCWFFCFLFLFFFIGFDGHDGVLVVQWFLWIWCWLWLCIGGWMKYYFIVMFILFYCVKN